MAGFTSVTTNLQVGAIGQLAYGADSNFLTRSYVLQDSTPVPVGRGVVYDASNESAKLPSATGQRFLGVAYDDKTLPIESPAYDLPSAGGQPNMPVLKRGLVWVPITEDVDPTADVYLQHTSHSGHLPGTFRASSDSSNADQIPGTVAQWAGVYLATDGRALLSINLTA